MIMRLINCGLKMNSVKLEIKITSINCDHVGFWWTLKLMEAQ